MDTKIRETLVVEAAQDIEEILHGNMWDIITELMLGEMSEDELIYRLELQPLKLKLYLSRLENLTIIQKKEAIKNTNIEYVYELIDKHLEVVCSNNNLGKNILSASKKANSFSKFVTRGFKNSIKYSEDPSKYGAIFINANRDKVGSFKLKMNLLIDEFKSIEDCSEDQVYLFMPMLFPYGRNESGV